MTAMQALPVSAVASSLGRRERPVAERQFSSSSNRTHPDVRGSREEHHEAIDAHAPAASGRQANLQCAAKVFVWHLRLVVAAVLLALLLLKASPLLGWIVELRVGVAYLLAADEELKALSDSRLERKRLVLERKQKGMLLLDSPVTDDPLRAGLVRAGVR
jgi:hypothetical protein